ncbi:hypothetical protein BDV59DRAFT_195203 [Aspergillus ambiguus]|uniref:putative protein kinase (Gcn2) n=1 Tax=Aspergillus ambiguus TaxID=176160 RepID=UPI003CCDA6FF
MYQSLTIPLLGLLALYPIHVTLGFLKNRRFAQQIGLPYMIFPFSEHSVLYLGLVETRWYRYFVDHYLPTRLVDHVNNSSFKYRWRVKDRISKHYGPVYMIVTPWSVTCHISDAKVVAQVCMARRSFPKPVENYEAFAIYGPSILTSEGSQWAHYRRYTSAAFNEKNNALVWHESIRQGVQMTNCWEAEHVADPSCAVFSLPDVRDDVVKYTLNIICSAGFGVRLPFKSASQATTGDTEGLFLDAAIPPQGYSFTFPSVMEYISNYMTTVFLANGIWPKWIPRKMAPFFKNDFMAYDDLKKYLQTLLENAEVRDNPSSYNLLEGLVKTRREDSKPESSNTVHRGLSDEEILGNLYIFMIAGHETTATTLRFAIVLLAMHQDIQDRLYSEIQDVADGESADLAEWDYERIFPKLVTPLCIMLETLRLYPAVSSLPKWTGDSDASISYRNQTYRIPHATHMSLDANALHYDELYWGPNASEFDPSRWDRRNANSFLANNDGLEGLTGPGLEHDTIHRPVRGAFLPFSDGVRACVGKRFAQVEFVAALVVIFRDYRVSLGRNGDETESEMQQRVQQALQQSSNALTIGEKVPLSWAPDFLHRPTVRPAMPHKQKKHSKHAPTNSSPQAEKRDTVVPGGSPLGSPVAARTNYQEIHQNEVEALRSIYGDDFEDVQHRRSAWHQSSDLSFKLHLRASSNPDVRLEMLVELPATYPKTYPNLSLENIDDLRQRSRARVLDIIRNKPKELLGSEMIYEIAVSIQDVLEDVAEAQAQDKDLPSLEEERMEQEAAANQRAEQERQEELRKQEAATAEEERALQQLLQDKIRERTKARVSRRKSRTMGMDSNSDVESVEHMPGAISFDPPLVMSDTDEGPLSFRAVYGKTHIQSRAGKETFSVRPVVSENRPCAPLLVLKELTIDAKDVEPLAFRERMRSSEDKLESLKKLRHPNLVEFVGFKICRPLDTDNPDGQAWKVYLLFEHANKGSLSEFLDIVGMAPVDMLRSWTIQLLEALEFYHRSGFVHGDIRCERVMLFRTSNGGTVVKLQASIEDALPDTAGSKRSLTTSKSPFWLPPELTQDNASPTMKTDVWDLGIVFLQMGFGMDVLQRYTSANALMDALGLSASLQDLLYEFFKPDPKKRPTAFQLQPSEFFRVDTPLIARSSASNSISLPRRPRLDSFGGLPAFSRYNQDFDEAGRLGKGGFGQVVKARNKLDGRFYAIKKISQRSAAALKDTLSEIMLLSRLNHPYVVRYYTAWLEEDYDHIDEEAVSSTDGDYFASHNSAAFEYSTGGLDFISSSGYPKIEFGSDSEDEHDGSLSYRYKGETPETYGTESGTGKELSRVRSGSQGRPVLTTLYIQMEYCEKHTLRDLIKNGLSDDVDRSWRLFRQILDGLSHIHSNGIIHRDLKPDNIFIDVANNPRIGDFGLATSGQFTTAVRSSAAADFAGDFTRSLGTTYYVAPEMKSGFTGNYSEKVDMFSLGVIFFEMCHPLPTGMERDQTLRAIREKNHTLPATFHYSDKVVQGRIIESLLSHNPSQRPSASELLQSGQIPLQVEEETFRRAIMHLLSDPNSPDYKKILSGIFSQSPKKFEDIAWDMDSHGYPAANELLVQGLVKERLTAIFRKHGAVETSRQLLFPRSQHYNNGAMRLLDASGNLLQLPFDLTLPNARSISRQDPNLEKSFAFGTVYREMPHGGEPRTHKEVDFDIVSHNALDLALKEAEVIKVLDEIIEEFPPLRSASMCFLVNHSDLLQLIMEFCRITPSQIPLVKEIVSKLNIGKWTMQKIRSELRSPSIGVASTSLDDLARFDFRDSPKQTQRRLKSIMEGTKFVERLTPIFARINLLVTYLQSFDVKRKVYVNPLGSLNDKFFRGSILFQCVFDTKRRDVFAAGGRYDSLIQEFRPKLLTSRSQTHAVGFNLSWDRLSSSMVEYVGGLAKQSIKQAEHDSGAFWKTRRCDVLVASFDPTVLRTIGIKVVQDLWANDISGELAVDASSLEELLTKYRDHNHSWIVIAKQDSKERGFKVKCLAPREEWDIRSSELIPWLRNEIRARNQREGAVEQRQARLPSQADVSAVHSERANDVRILAPLHRNKKSNRRNIVEQGMIYLAPPVLRDMLTRT